MGRAAATSPCDAIHDHQIKNSLGKFSDTKNFPFFFLLLLLERETEEKRREEASCLVRSSTEVKLHLCVYIISSKRKKERGEEKKKEIFSFAIPSSWFAFGISTPRIPSIENTASVSYKWMAWRRASKFPFPADDADLTTQCFELPTSRPSGT